jgi:predicted Zn-dependent protease
MTSISAKDTVKRLDAMIAKYVSDLEKLPSSQRLSESSLSTVYAMACALLQSGQLPQASAYFSFLLLYAPTHPDYLCARASCAIQQSNPQMAVNLLSLALYVKPQSCAIALALVEALVATDATEAARHILQQVRRLALPEDATLLARAELWLQTLTEQALHAAT